MQDIGGLTDLSPIPFIKGLQRGPEEKRLLQSENSSIRVSTVPSTPNAVKRIHLNAMGASLFFKLLGGCQQLWSTDLQGYATYMYSCEITGSVKSVPVTHCQ